MNDICMISAYHKDVTDKPLAKISLLLNCFIHTEDRSERGGLHVVIKLRLILLELDILKLKRRDRLS